jgi:putative phosphoribosyl transferase
MTRTFLNREEGGHLLAEELQGRALRDPLVLGIPRGGVVTAAAIAHDLGAELDVVLVRKLRHPMQPELAIGAIDEDGKGYLNVEPSLAGGFDEEYLRREKELRWQELKDRREFFRAIHSAAPMQGRSVIITDDGIATGSTMLAAVQVVKAHQPYEVIVAVPVASPSSVQDLRAACDEVVCLASPENFFAIGQFYEDFTPLTDDQVRQLLCTSAPAK